MGRNRKIITSAVTSVGRDAVSRQLFFGQLLLRHQGYHRDPPRGRHEISRGFRYRRRGYGHRSPGAVRWRQKGWQFFSLALIKRGLIHVL